MNGEPLGLQILGDRRVDQPAAAIAEDLEAEGFAVHVVGEHLLQVCVTDLNAARTDELVAAFEEVI